jgi:hypothetical protein
MLIANVDRVGEEEERVKIEFVQLLVLSSKSVIQFSIIKPILGYDCIFNDRQANIRLQSAVLYL